MYSTPHAFFFSLGKNQFFLFNTMNHCAVIVSASYVSVFKNPNNTSSPNRDEALAFLTRYHFVFKTQADEQRHFNTVIQDCTKSALLNTTPAFALILNSHCNFKCQYCFESEAYKSKNQPLTIEQAAAVIKSIPKLLQARKKQFPGAKRWNRHVTIYGGEPLLPQNHAVMEFFLEQFRKRKMTATIITNGYHFQNFAALFSKYRRVINTVQLTLDGTKAVHNRRRKHKGRKRDTFTPIADAVDALSSMKIGVILRSNVDQGNAKNLRHFLSYAKKRKWLNNPYIHLEVSPINKGPQGTGVFQKRWKAIVQLLLPFKDPLHPDKRLYSIPTVGVTSTLFARLIRDRNMIRPVYCTLGHSWLLNTDGKIYPCPHAMTHPQGAMGTFFPKFTWFPKRSYLMKKGTRVVNNIKACKNCGLSLLCGGGCPQNAYLKHGDAYREYCAYDQNVLKDFWSLLGPLVLENNPYKLHGPE